MIKFSAAEKKRLQTSAIAALVLFGSRAQAMARGNSDYDVLVIGKKTAANYDLIYDLFASKINRLVNIDIVFSADAPLELKNHVVKYGRVIFQASPAVFADFKAQTMLEAADFAFYRQMFHQAILNRLSL
jgi:predicted nucleotidyltransferase